MFKHISSAAACGAFFLVANAASATTLTFGSNACAVSCTNGAAISQSYGDLAGILDISYRTVTAPGSTTATADPVSYWGAGFGDLTTGVWGSNNDLSGTVEVVFKLIDPTRKITFNSVEFAGFAGTPEATKLALYSLAGSGAGALLTSLPSATAPGTGHLTWAPSIQQTGGIVFHIGPSGYNTGFTNLTYTLEPLAAVPEPATWGMLVVGFAAAGFAMRRRARLRVALA